MHAHASHPRQAAHRARGERDHMLGSAQRNHAHLSFFAHAAPPVPPAIEREDDKEDLQQRVGKQRAW